MTALLAADGIRKSYGALDVLKGVSFDVGHGETFAIIGPNGAGKTTLFKALTGESLPDAGRVMFEGRDITGMPAFRRARIGFGRTFQVARVFPEMTVVENVITAVEARGAPERWPGRWYDWRPAPGVMRAAMALLEDVGLARSAPIEARFLSHGDKKRLEFAITLAGRPRILLLDEPTAGMSPPDRVATAALIAHIRATHGVTVIMTEHDMDVIFGLAHRLMVMNYGEVLAIGRPADVRADPVVRDVYLGQEMIRA